MKIPHHIVALAYNSINTLKHSTLYCKQLKLRINENFLEFDFISSKSFPKLYRMVTRLCEWLKNKISCNHVTDTLEIHNRFFREAVEK